MSTDRQELRAPDPNPQGAISTGAVVTTMSAGRLEFLDFMRAIAALAVLAEHGGYHFVRGFAIVTHTIFSFGKFGITAFFLVSGFIIPLSLERRPELTRFWLLRFFRLYPLYWFSLAAAILLYAVGDRGALTPEFAAHPLRNTIANLTMLQGILFVPHAIGLYYTLTIELIFYLACTLLLRWDKLRHAYAITWIILGSATSIALGTPLARHHRVEMAGLFYVVTLAVGSAIYGYYKGSVSPRALTLLFAGVVCFVISGTWLNYAVNKKPDPFEHYTFVAVALPWVLSYALFLSLLALRGINYPKSMLYVGRISYSLYLLHPLVLSLFEVKEGNTWGFILFALSSLLLSACTFQLIEQPAYNLGQRIAKLRLQAKSTLLKV